MSVQQDDCSSDASSLDENQHGANLSYVARIRSNLLDQSRQFRIRMSFHWERFHVLFLRTYFFHFVDYTNAPRSVLRQDYIRSIIAYIAVHLAVICSNTTMFVVQYLKREETLLNCLIYTFSFGVALVILLIFTLVYIAKNHPYKTKIFEDDNLMMDDLNLDESSQRNLQNESFTYQSFQSQPLNIPGASRLTRVRRPLTVNTDASSSYDCFENDEVFHLSMTTGASGDSMLVNASDAVSSSKQADVHQVLCLGYNRSAAVDRDFWISGARSSPCQESPVTNEDSLSDEVFKSVDSEDDSSEMPSLHKESSSVEMMQCGAEEDFLPIEEQPQ